MYNGTENLKMMTWSQRDVIQHHSHWFLFSTVVAENFRYQSLISKCFEKSLLIDIITINRIAKLNKTVGKKITREIIELNCSQLNINQFKRSYILLLQFAGAK